MSHHSPLRRAALACTCALALLAAGCRDEPPRVLPDAALTEGAAPVRTSALRAGGYTPDVPATNPYDGDAQALAAGRRLYGSMNCAGCHGPEGGGGIGPPFADAEWIYGAAPENIVQSVLQGRPNGMPAFAGKLPPGEVWKIAAFLTDLSKKGQAKAGYDPKAPAVTAAGK
ncbi:c-type cytochrome [Roseisolibacter sp. H3M3-2]|uniref:c-type cytochrome n=1 Tax=Roseisolibacter sp. H3M3-2 TaxID=3031323 RepID=UPI0023DBF0C0|nr:c-type cytochrome [Roseisolibacter sp. H3M3-2]MDF1504880.1 c-type cytochrome [Roseisolibacter sp. H3M3-2]